MRRYILGSALALAIPLWTGSAQALTLVTCSGTDRVHFSPGVTYQQQTVALSGQDSGTCSSLTNPSLHSVADPFGGTVPLSCNALTTSGVQATETLYWNGGTTPTSQWDNTSHIEFVNGNLVSVLTGPITSGTLAGATLTLTVTMLASQLDACSQPGGLEDLSGPATWVFTGI
jgi:hypothetical protein